jgi:16S rRNA (cytosine967-C5)-methyltransferase
MGTGRSPAKRSGSSAVGSVPKTRAAALRAVRRVVEEGAYSNLAIPGELDRAGLRGRDRAFAGDLAFGTIRRMIPIDASLGAASHRPLRELEPEVLALLRLGAYQILFSRVPPHAAVGETVSLAPARYRGFANAVLRSLVRRPPPPPAGTDDGAISLRTGLARWAVAELRRLLPDEEVEPAAAAFASPASLTLRANRCRTEPAALERALRAAGQSPEPGRFHPDVFRVPGAIPTRLLGWRQGWFAVQDEASVLVAAALQVAAGERVLDACAGPGGKAAHLSCAAQPGGLVVAADVRAGRVDLVRTTAERLGADLRLLVQDARRPALRPGSFDAVLVDAPCSGIGAARRRPELLWRVRREDLSTLARLQVAILTAAADLVRPGGRIVYSVCTFPRAETDAALRAFGAKRPDFEPAVVPGPGGPASTHRLWPHRHDTDAMFFAGLTRGRATSAD